MRSGGAEWRCGEGWVGEGGGKEEDLVVREKTVREFHECIAFGLGIRLVWLLLLLVVAPPAPEPREEGVVWCASRCCRSIWCDGATRCVGWEGLFGVGPGTRRPPEVSAERGKGQKSAGWQATRSGDDDKKVGAERVNGAARRGGRVRQSRCS